MDHHGRKSALQRGETVHTRYAPEVNPQHASCTRNENKIAPLARGTRIAMLGMSPAGSQIPYLPTPPDIPWDHYDLEKRSCQLFYYCVHMARKTTSLCYVSFYVRCSVFHLGYVSLYVRCSVLDLPTGGSRVLCTCTAAAGRHCVAVQSVFGCACARKFLLWNCFLHELFRIFRLLAGLFRFGAAETSFRGILLNDRWVDQFPLIHLLVLTLSFTKSVLILGGMQ